MLKGLLRRSALLGLLCCALGAAAPAAAQAPGVSVGELTGILSTPGEVSLVSYGPVGSIARYYEIVDGRAEPLGIRGMVARPDALLDRATQWRCDRRLRRFRVVTSLPDGSTDTDEYTVRTPSCANRLAVRSATRVRPGASLRVRLSDRFQVGGYGARVCAIGPGGRFSCRDTVAPRGRRTAAVTFHPRTRGIWRVRVQARGFRAERRLRVGRGRAPRQPARRLPTLLTTGDSTMQGVDAYLEDRLAGRVRATTQVQAGTGISKDGSWSRRARRQAARLRPALTVISIGANDAFPMRGPKGTASCCGPRWVIEYERRVRGMMRSYTRGGGRVLWMTLPAPRERFHLMYFAAVNVAVARAAAGLPRVELARMDLLFSPLGRFEPTLRRRGRTERVRSTDGIHLSDRGTAIAAEALTSQIDRLGWLAPR